MMWLLRTIGDRFRAGDEWWQPAVALLSGMTGRCACTTSIPASNRQFPEVTHTISPPWSPCVCTLATIGKLAAAVCCEAILIYLERLKEPQLFRGKSETELNHFIDRVAEAIAGVKHTEAIWFEIESSPFLWMTGMAVLDMIYIGIGFLGWKVSSLASAVHQLAADFPTP